MRIHTVARTSSLGFALLLLACTPADDTDPPSDAAAASTLSVYVVNDPLRYFAERIAGARANVVFPAPPGVDPAYWIPDPETVAAYQGADLILRSGAGYARWIELASLPRARTIDTSQAFRERLLPLEETVAHRHGPTGEHTHTGLAFTTWLDPTLASLHAAAIADALVRLRPEHETEFRQNLGALEHDLKALDQQLATAARRLGATPLLFSHPVYPYLIQRYDLNARSLHLEPDEPPSAAQWRELRELLAEHPARWMLWEDTPPPETARQMRELGVNSGVFHPAAGVPAAGDFLAIMQQNAAQLEAVARDAGG
jgi:zinc transport system substrate-binding protein